MNESHTSTRVLPDGNWLQSAVEALAAALAVHMKAESPKAANRPEYLSVEEVAEVLRCRPQRVYDLLSRRCLPRHKDGRRVLIRAADLDRYLASNARSAR